MTTQIIYNEQKLIELILYIGAKCCLDEHYGVLKLNKILFYSDFTAFKTRGEAITGAEYRKYPHGPAPAVMKVLKHQLAQSGEVFEYENPLPGLDAEGQPMSEKRLLPKRKPEIDELFDAEEVAVVDEVIKWLRPMTGTQVSRMSHRHPGWQLVGMEQEIPYSTALLSEEPPAPLPAKDHQRAVAVADRFEAGGYVFGETRAGAD